MIKHVRLIFLISTLLITSTVNSKEPQSCDYLEYVNEIIEDFAKEMKTKYDLRYYGSGGSMPTDVEEIEAMFISYHHMTVDEARKVEINAIQDLIRRINSHEKIRPYLREYPFHQDRVGVSISFRTKTDDRPFDGSVALVFLAKNKIFYKAAEMKMSASIPMTRIDENNKWTTEIKPGELRETLTSLHEETYEEALKIAGITPHPHQKQ